MNALVMRGDYWEVRYGGAVAMIEDCRGLHYIAWLMDYAIANRGPVHAKELVARATGREPGPIELETKDYVLDASAQTQLIKRLEEIALERDQACATENFTAAAELDEEYERIAEELKHAAAPRRGRRGGTFSDAGEKARKAVSKAITEAIARIGSAANLPPLAEHLTSAIRKGQWLSYEGPTDWKIEFRAPLPRK